MRRSSSSSRATRLCRLALLVAILTAGCAQVRYLPPAGEEGPGPAVGENAPRYEQVVSQDAAMVAGLRAAPPPDQPQVSDGATPAGDEQALNSRGFARIGDAYVPADFDHARDWIGEQARRVGADKVLVYAPDSDGTTYAAFYVRYRLPFGATFRSLTAGERTKLGSGGVQIGDVVGGTPASEANLRSGDFVLKFDGRAIADRPAFEKLLRAHLGKRVTLTVSRSGVVFERLVLLGVIARPAAVSEHRR